MTIINLYSENGFDIRSLSNDNYKKIIYHHLSNADRNIELICNELTAEEILSIESDLNTGISPFVLTNDYDYEIINKDFNLFNINRTYEYNEDFTIKSITYNYNESLAIKEEFEYIYDQELVSQIDKTISWYRLNGIIGATKVLNRVYKDAVEKEDKTIDLREKKLRRVKASICENKNYKTSIYEIKAVIDDYLKYDKKDELNRLLEEKFNFKEKL